MKDERLIFRLPSEKKRKFLEKADRQGKKTAEILNELVDRYLEESEKVYDLQEIIIRLEKLEGRFEGESVA